MNPALDTVFPIFVTPTTNIRKEKKEKRKVKTKVHIYEFNLKSSKERSLNKNIATLNSVTLLLV